MPKPKTPPNDIFNALEEIFDTKLPRNPTPYTKEQKRADQRTLEAFHALPKAEQEILIQEQISAMYNYNVKVELKGEKDE